jgi:AhpC/TSA family
MKQLIPSCLLLASMSAFTSLSAGPQNKDEVAKLTLKVGDTAPDFNLLSNEWKTIKLSDFHGKKNAFLSFYVFAFTGG